MSTGCVYLKIPFAQGDACFLVSTTQYYINDQENMWAQTRRKEPLKSKFDEEYYHAFLIDILNKLILLFIKSVIGTVRSHMDGWNIHCQHPF